MKRHEACSWIADEELPIRANLIVIRKNDPDFGMSDEEIQDRYEFIHWYLMQDFVLLTTIPKQEPGDDFFIADCTVTHPDYSAFNTVDYQRNRRPFDKYAYAMKKTMERVMELAVMHSSISQPEGRSEIRQRYEAFVDTQFRDRLQTTVARYHHTTDPELRFELKLKIAKLNQNILECKKVWERYAPPENWDL